MFFLIEDRYAFHLVAEVLSEVGVTNQVTWKSLRINNWFRLLNDSTSSDNLKGKVDMEIPENQQFNVFVNSVYFDKPKWHPMDIEMT